MRAAVLTEIGSIEVQQIPEPLAAPGDIVIEVAAAGICGSDLHAWHGRHPFRRPPIVLGHEVSGTIIALGEGVTTHRIGDRVVIEPQRLCGSCEHCIAGRNELCATKVLPGMNGWNGALAERFSAPATVAHPIPDSLDLDLAALVEPLAVAVHANRRANVSPGERVSVIGAGPIGLLALTVAQRFGADVDVVTDIDPSKLALATELGAARASDVRSSPIVSEVGASVADQADVTIVAATAPQSIVEATQLTKPGGRILLLGLYESRAEFDASSVVTKEQTIVSSVLYDSSDFRTAIELLAAEPALFERFITTRIPLEGADEEFRAQAERRKSGLKTLLLPRL